MNILPDGVTVRFKTELESLFEVEKSGAKPNTVRILDAYEADQIKHKAPTKIIIQCQQEIFLRTLTDIHLHHNFLDKVIAIFSWTNEEHHHTIDNETEKDGYAHTQSLDTLEGPLLKSQTINISLPLRKRMDLHRGEDTYDKFISKMLDDYMHPPHQHTMPEDWNRSPGESEGYHADHTTPVLLPWDLINDLRRNSRKSTIPEFLSHLLAAHQTHYEEALRGFVQVTVTKEMLKLLQKIAYGRSMNSTIRYLYQLYLDTRTEEGRLL